MTAILIANLNWKWTFYLQTMLIIPCLFAFMITPIEYFDIELAVRRKKFEEDRFAKKNRS